LIAGERSALRVTVQNASALPWPALSFVNMGNHWKSADGSAVVIFDDGRGPLPVDLAPGERATVDLVITSPPTPGRYLLEIDMVEENVCWFVDRGSPILATAVEVGPQTSSSGCAGNQENTQALSDFAMHGLPPARVIAAARRQGGHVVAIDDDNAAGDGWQSYRYVVSKGPTAGGT
jgi:hypothetical protein